jgi:hypothetical protein
MREMSFFKSFLFGIKLYFFFALAISLGFFIEIQRYDLNGTVSDNLNYISQSIDILITIFSLFSFYVGSKQSNLIRRKIDSGFAAAISSIIGFLIFIYLNYIIIVLSLWIAEENMAADPILGIINASNIGKMIPCVFAAVFAAIINNTVSNKKQIEPKSDIKTGDGSSPTPWVYSIGVTDEHGFEWIKHNNKQWFRAANSGNEWTEYS